MHRGSAHSPAYSSTHQEEKDSRNRYGKQPKEAAYHEHGTHPRASSLKEGYSINEAPVGQSQTGINIRLQ